MGDFSMFGVNWLSAGAGAVLAGAATFGAMTAWTSIVTIPAARQQAAALAEAQAAERTHQAIEEISSDAEKARFMRRYCRDAGRLYDFQFNRCREA
jgi:hypothetical protein